MIGEVSCGQSRFSPLAAAVATVRVLAARVGWLRRNDQTCKDNTRATSTAGQLQQPVVRAASSFSEAVVARHLPHEFA